jgi:hypothetical protein
MKFDRKTWALAVGIETYDFPVPVPGAVEAAVQFADLLREKGVPPEHIYLRLAPESAEAIPDTLKLATRGPATYAGLRTLLEQELPKKGGTLLCVFWAGHGAVDGRARRLYPADSDLYGTFDFESLLWLPADRRYDFPTQLVFVDACANDPGAFGMHKRWWDFNMEWTTAPRGGQFVFFAANRGQPAEFKEGTGVYSRELIRLLRTDPPPASVEELEYQLHRHFVAADGPQRPYYYFRMAGGRGEITWGGLAERSGESLRHREVPTLPVGYIERSDELDALRALVVRDTGRDMAITAVRGMPGAGKTVLVGALLKHEAITKAYPDGVLWLKVGQAADPLRVIHEVAVALGESPENRRTPDDGSSQVRRLLLGRKALIVLDDVWHASHVLNLRTEKGTGSALLITTRMQDVVSQTRAAELSLGRLTEAQALRLLASRCGQSAATLPAEATGILQECGYLALAVAIVGARLRSKPPAIWKLVLQQLASADLEAVGELEEYEHRSVFRAIHVSLKDLSEAARVRYSDICVFPEDAAVTTAALETLWNAPPEDVLGTVEAWVGRALAEFDAAGRITFHDLHLDYARHAHGDPAPIYQRFLDAYRRKSRSDAANCLWSAVPDDGYIRRHLAHHLEATATPRELHRLLAEHTPSGQNAWYEAKAAVDDVPGYLEDVRRAWRLARKSERGSPESVATRLGLQVRYLLVSSSVRGTIRGVPAGLWADALAAGVVTASASLALIEEIPGESEQLEILLALIDRFNEADRLKVMPHLLVKAERMKPSSRMTLLLKLTPYLPPAGKQKALELSAMAAGESTASRQRVDALCVQAALDTDPTARQARLEEALGVAKELALIDADRDPFVRLARLLPERVDEIVEVFLSRQTADRAALAEYVGHIAALLPQAGNRDRDRLVQAALAAADLELDFKWARALRPIAGYLPARVILGRWAKVRDELARHRGTGLSSNFTAATALEIAGLMLPDDRGLVMEEVLDSVRAMGTSEYSFGTYVKAEALARLVPLVARDVRNLVYAEAHQAATRLRSPQLKSRVLHLLANQAVREERPSLLRAAWDAARSLDDADEVLGSVGMFAPWLEGETMEHALRIVEQLSAPDSSRWDRSFQRNRSIQQLAVRLAELRETSRALRILSLINDRSGRDWASGLLGMVGFLTEGDLVNALADIRARPPGYYRALGLWALSNRLPDQRKELVAEAFREPFENWWVDHHAVMTSTLVRLGYARDAVRLVREKVERYDDRVRLLRSIAASLPATTDRADLQWLAGEWNALLGRDGDLLVASAMAPGLCDGQVVRRALQTIDHERDSVAKAFDLGRWLPHLPESDRAARVEEIFSLHPRISDEADKGRLMNLVAPYVPKELIHRALELADAVDREYIRWLLPLPVRVAELGHYDRARQFVQPIDNPGVRARALAGLIPHAPADRRVEVLAESFATLSEWDDWHERSKAWDELRPFLEMVPVDDLDRIWSDALLKLAGNLRRDLIWDLAAMLPLISLLGGQQAVQLVFEALREATPWWK